MSSQRDSVLFSIGYFYLVSSHYLESMMQEGALPSGRNCEVGRDLAQVIALLLHTRKEKVVLVYP